MANQKRRKTETPGHPPDSDGSGGDGVVGVLDRLLAQLEGGQPITLDCLSPEDLALLHGAPNAKAAVIQAASRLQSTASKLQAAVDRAQRLTVDSTPVVDCPSRVDDIIAYAHRLSYSTHAPPGFVPGQTPLGHFKPPAPQEFQLRSSQLHQFHKRLVAAVQAAAPVEPAAPPPAPAPRPVSAAFNFALNPDMDLEFGGVDSDSDDSSEED